MKDVIFDLWPVRISSTVIYAGAVVPLAGGPSPARLGECESP